MIDMMPVDSEDILTIGYDDKKSALHIKYDDDRQYEYHQIDLDMFTNLLFSPSKSEFIEENIFDKFSCIKID